MKGLTNVGNTCYINTTLQCLANCDVFLNYFIKTFKSSDFLNIIEKEKEKEKEENIDENQRKKQEQEILDHFVLLKISIICWGSETKKLLRLYVYII